MSNNELQQLLAQGISNVLAGLVGGDQSHYLNIIIDDDKEDKQPPMLEHLPNMVENKEDEKGFGKDVSKAIKCLSSAQNKQNSAKNKIKQIETYCFEYFKHKINIIDMNSVWSFITCFSVNCYVADTLVMHVIYKLLDQYLDSVNIDGVMSVFEYIEWRVIRDEHAYRTSRLILTNLENNTYVQSLKYVINKLKTHTFCRHLATSLHNSKKYKEYRAKGLDIITLTIKLWDTYYINYYEEQDFFTNFIDNYPAKDCPGDVKKKVVTKIGKISCAICMSDDYNGLYYQNECGTSHVMCQPCFENHFRENYKTIMLERSYFVLKCPFCREYNQVYKTIANKILGQKIWTCECGEENKLCEKWCMSCPKSISGSSKWTCSTCTYQNCTPNICEMCGAINVENDATMVI